MDSPKHYVLLMKDDKPICRGVFRNLPDGFPRSKAWRVQFKKQPKEKEGFCELKLYPAPENDTQMNEWPLFFRFLKNNRKVAFVEFGGQVFDIHLPGDLENSPAVVRYQTKKECIPHYDYMHCERSYKVPTDANSSDISWTISPDKGVKLNSTSEAWVKSVDSPVKTFPNRFKEVTGNSHAPEVKGETIGMTGTKVDGLANRNSIQMHPSYLKTLGQAHSDWIFGAIAELVDNARDAKSTKLGIYIEMVHSELADEKIPMLCIIDDGLGMNYVEIARMLSFGHQQPDVDDPERTGRFGVGFKTGAMRIGKDAMVLTQTTTSRSIAFLSQSLNDGKSNLEIPIVSYHRKGHLMKIDTNVQTKELAKCNLESIKQFSPFDEYFIGVKCGQFNENGTGTQLFIWNLDKWGSNYCLEWLAGETAVRSSSDHQGGDILIRSRKIRSRPGQTSQKVPLDYSLRSYLELIFLDPRMKIFVQGSLVKSRPLAKSLEQTISEEVSILGKPVQLTLGRCQLEWEQANCGFFLYWHGRLIEAYKRVGGMIHNADTGRGIIGVVDVTELMNDGNEVWIHNNKQGFQDCEQYVELERLLGSIFNSYWEDNFDSLQLEKDTSLCKPDHDWVQCNKCRKWRILPPVVDSTKLPREWFCYMEPFNGKCEIPEQKVGPDIVNISTRHVTWDSEKNVSELDEGILLKSSNGEIRMSSPRKKRCSNKRTQINYEKSPLVMQPPKGYYNTSKNKPKMKDGAKAPTFRKHGKGLN